MKNGNTKEKIIKEANLLFRKYGYEATGIRDIARACGISVSNLQYYFPKKVHIMSSVYDLALSEYYERESGSDPCQDKSLMEIMCLEYEFIVDAMNGESWNSYISSLLIPEVCNVYIEKSTALFMDNHVLPGIPRFRIRMANTVMYGGISEEMQFYLANKNTYDMDELLKYPFQARLYLLDVPDGDKLIDEIFDRVKKKFFGNNEPGQENR